MLARNPQQEAEYQRALQLRARQGQPQIINSPSSTGGISVDSPGANALQAGGGGIPTIDQRYGAGATANSESLGTRLYQGFRDKLNATPFTPLQESPQSYYDSIKGGLQQDLTKAFFGQGGKFENALASESAAGRLDSPVSRRILSETVSTPFAEQTRQIGRDVFQAQEQAKQQIQQLNQQFNASYNELAYRVAQSERGILSAEQEAQLDADIRAYEAQLSSANEQAKIGSQIDIAQLQNETEQQKNAINFLSTPIQYNETTQPIASRLSQKYGGQALPAGGPAPLANPYNSLYTPNSYMTADEIAKLPPQQLNALPSQGSFLGQIVRGPDNRNYAWRGGLNGWQVVYS